MVDPCQACPAWEAARKAMEDQAVRRRRGRQVEAELEELWDRVG